MSTPADIIAVHRDGWTIRDGHQFCTCRCGWESEPIDLTGTLGVIEPLAHAAHVMQALADAGYTIVRLPEGEKRAHVVLTDRIVTDYLAHNGHQIIVSTSYGETSVQDVTGLGGRQYTPAEARRIGAAYLAAADAAEEGVQ